MEQMSDEEFIDFVVMRRMELRYSQWNSIRRSKTKKEHDKIEKAYEAAISSLSKADKGNIVKYLDTMFEDSSEETNFFYRAGVRDGYNLYRKIMEFQESEKESVS